MIQLLIFALLQPGLLSARGEVRRLDGGFATAEGGGLTLRGEGWLLQLSGASEVRLDGFVVQGEARLDAARPVKLRLGSAEVEVTGRVWFKGGVACGAEAPPLPECPAPLPSIRFDWPAPALASDVLPPPPAVEALRSGEGGDEPESGGETACLDSGDGGGEAAGGEGAAGPEAELEGTRAGLNIEVRWSP
ncbi:hypothetical protein KKF91_06955 [Myxococcota bacterium]|nr:hypothetical protein [Myxococcota bacterium]MBU1430294.1 hypothetical protein [Myxococcota bacterium]MBU1896258.1 hypothetical protein [Myxococcota bacterium]